MVGTSVVGIFDDNCSVGAVDVVLMKELDDLLIIFRELRCWITFLWREDCLQRHELLVLRLAGKSPYCVADYAVAVHSVIVLNKSIQVVSDNRYDSDSTYVFVHNRTFV